MLCLLLCCFLIGLRLLSKRWLVGGVLPRVWSPSSFFLRVWCVRPVGGWRVSEAVVGGLPCSSPVCVCSKEELFEAVYRQRSNLEMQASAQSTPPTGNPAQKKNEPATQLHRWLQNLADGVADMEKDLALQPMAFRAKSLVRAFWNLEKLLSTSQNTVVPDTLLDTLLEGFVEERVADTDLQAQLVLDALLVSGVFSFLVFFHERAREDLHKSDQRWAQRTDQLGQKVQDLSKSVDELRAEVALMRDTVQLDLTEKLKHVADLAAEARSEMMQGQLRDFHQHSEVQALSGSLRKVLHEVQEDVQRIDGETNELSQLQKQLDMRTEVGANEHAQVRRGLKDQEKLVQRIFASFDVRAEVKSQGTELHELRCGLAEHEKSMLRLFTNGTASERKAT